MNILKVQKFFYLHGGGSRYFFEISNLLRKHKHDLAFFAMKDEKNKHTEWDKYFVSNLSFETIDLKNSLKIFTRMIYSFEAREKISQLLTSFRPDIVHLYDIYHHISPSIIFEFKKRNFPVIQRFGDYHFISPNYNLFHNGKICEVAKPVSFYKAIFHKCVKNSYLASFAEVAEKYIHYLSGWDRKYIDTFIVPSHFMKNKFIEYGIPEEKIVYLHNFIDSNMYQFSYGSGEYLLYFGRLSIEKGLDLLLKSMVKLPRVKLKIVGRGPELNNLLQLSKGLQLNNTEFIEFIDGKQLKNIISNSWATVLPSIWYENSPNSILESFASGKPVIASNIGGIPELVVDGFNGLLFKPNSQGDCIDKINQLWRNKFLRKKLGRNARDYVEKRFSPEEHYYKLIDIYKKAIEKHK